MARMVDLDYRNLLKACIRGQMYDHDVPVPPCRNPELVESELSVQETAEFICCAREVFAEELETRDLVKHGWDELLSGQWREFE